MKKTNVSFIMVIIALLILSTFVTAANLVDGTYEGWSDASDKSINYAKVFVENGKMVAVILKEYTNLLIEKDFSVYPWPQAKEAYQTMGQKFVQAQSHEIDMITGATGSSKGYIQAVERALLKANPDAKLGKYFDGVYFGSSGFNEFQYYEVVKVTIKNDKVENVSFERILSDFSFQDPQEYGWPLEFAWEAYSDAAKDAVPGFVDGLTGATGICLSGNIAVRDALDRASTK